MSGVFSAAATDVLALDATDVFSADTTDVLSAAKAADGGCCLANNPCASGWRSFFFWKIAVLKKT